MSEVTAPLSLDGKKLLVALLITNLFIQMLMVAANEEGHTSNLGAASTNTHVRSGSTNA